MPAHAPLPSWLTRGGAGAPQRTVVVPDRMVTCLRDDAVVTECRVPQPERDPAPGLSQRSQRGGSVGVSGRWSSSPEQAFL